VFGDTKKGSNKPLIKDDRHVGKNKREERKSIIDKTLHIKLKLNSTNQTKLEINSIAPEWFVVPAPLV
jgi:hypothetical protein